MTDKKDLDKRFKPLIAKATEVDKHIEKLCNLLVEYEGVRREAGLSPTFCGPHFADFATEQLTVKDRLVGAIRKFNSKYAVGQLGAVGTLKLPFAAFDVRTKEAIRRGQPAEEAREAYAASMKAIGA